MPAESQDVLPHRSESGAALSAARHPVLEGLERGFMVRGCRQVLIVRITAQAISYADTAIADSEVQLTSLRIQLYRTRG